MEKGINQVWKWLTQDPKAACEKEMSRLTAQVEQAQETLKQTLQETSEALDTLTVQKDRELEALAAEKEQELQSQRQEFLREQEEARQAAQRFDALTGLCRWEIFLEKARELLSQDPPAPILTALCLETKMERQLPELVPLDLPGVYLLSLGNDLRQLPQSLFARSPQGDLLGLVWGQEEAEMTQRLQRLLALMEDRSGLLPPAGISLRRCILGTAQYPADGQSPEALFSRARLAAYLAGKEGGRGLCPFTQKRSLLLTGQDAFRELLEKKQIGFLFQPIVRRTNAKVVGYELVPFSRNPKLEKMEDVRALAEYLGAGRELEKLLWMEGMDAAVGSMSQGRMMYNTKIWMKTGACLTDAAAREFSEKHFDALKNLVLELPAPTANNALLVGVQRQRAKEWEIQTMVPCAAADRAGELAIGYLQPELIRAEAALVRGIGADKAKQEAFAALKAYAAAHGAQLLAEGIEDAADLKTVVKLEADFLQGDFLCKAETFPADLPEKRIAQIGQAQYKRRGKAT